MPHHCGTPGYDAARLGGNETGRRLEGTAVFWHEHGAARLDYQVVCDTAWSPRRGHVQGWIGNHVVNCRIERTSVGSRMLDGALVRGLEGCLDLDFAFTPATNLLQLKRLALAPGQTADAPVAWFDPSAGTLERVPQRFERRSNSTSWYEAPSVPYAALLVVAPNGFILEYPRLWQAITGGS